MRICIVGAGYVGTVTGVCLAQLGNRIIFVDSDGEKLELIGERRSPIGEPGLDDIMRDIEIEATADLSYGVSSSEITFVCVATPTSSASGNSDTGILKMVCREIGKSLTRYHLVVIKSTVTPGTTERDVIPLLEKEGQKLGQDFGVCVNPEFLREGFAVHDFRNPDRIIIGETDERSGQILEKLYKGFASPILRVDLKTAEMIKIASNAFLATKISFINEIGNICKYLGIDVYEVVKGMAYDERIGNKFLNAGIGFGGSCLPKDLQALIAMSNRETGYRPESLIGVLHLNEQQPLKLIELLKRHVPHLGDRAIGILGLAFKPGTNDVRASRALNIVEQLLKDGARVKAYDPKAMPNFKAIFPHIEYVEPDEVLKCDAILILTDWEEFYALDYRDKIVIDGRRILKAKEARIYEGICW